MASENIAHRSVCHVYETPLEFFDVLNREFGFTIDVAATARNTKCSRFFSIKQNGLERSWRQEVCWMNPPYGRELPRWMRKAYTEARDSAATVVCLVPARTHTAWFHAYTPQAEVRFLRGRLRYVDTDGEAPFAQLLVIFRPGLIRPWGMKLWEWRPRTKQQLLFSMAG